MQKLKYILKYLRKINLKNMFNIIKKLSIKSGKSKISLFFDIVYCGFKYGAGYYDYQEFDFYLLTNKERKTYLTRTKNNMIVKEYNDKASFYKFDDKGYFNNLFKDYLKRDYLIINEDNFKDFENFTKKHQVFIVKPIDGDGGKGIEKINLTKKTDLKKLFNELLLKKQTLLEEYIIQNKKISELYPDSVNSLRLFTFFDGYDAYVLNSVFKLGNGGVIDNFSSGSMYTFVNDEGKVIVPAIDQNDQIYKIHPITKKTIIDFEVPFYQEACELVKQASKVVPEVKYIGWDVAISNAGPVIIEGNCFPGVFQIKPSLDKNHEGILPKYQKYMDIR